MKNKFQILLLLFLIACGAGVQPPPATVTLTPITATPITTCTATALATPTVTSIQAAPHAHATATRFQIHLESVCATATLQFGSQVSTGFLSDVETQAEFTGVYQFGTGHSVNDLVIDCDQTYHERKWLDFGALRFESGKVSVQDGLLVLDGIDKYGQSRQRIYLPIRWGPRHYLVDYVGGNEGFCRELARGAEPRTSAVGFDYLRIGDETLEATGDPIIPSGQKMCP